MTQSTLARAQPSGARRRSIRQPQIQALRALAVLAVIAYHYRPGLLPGGYAGVDVFFVISGYLMTSSILHLRAGGAGLGRTLREFYTRRLTRILPAAVVTLLVSALGTLAVVPLLDWPQTFREILAGAFFVENWALVADATDYLGGGGSSPVQHYWSLSVEEQFYAVWPWVVCFAAQAGPLLTARGRLVKLVACFGLLTGLSLLWSLHLTAADPAAAYFSTLTRFWELAFGGLVLVVDRHLRDHPAWRAGAGWLGLALIGWTLATYTDATPFPGWRAGLPVLGAALVIVSSPASASWGPLRALSWRPTQTVGDLSYSLYLLHWPLLVLAVRAHGGPLSPLRLVLLLALVGGSAALLKRGVEDPFRLTRPAAGPGGDAVRRPARLRRTVAVVAVGQLLVVAVAGGALWHHHRLVAGAADRTAAFVASAERQAACFAAVSADRSSAACPDPGDSVLGLLPSPLAAADDWPYGDCQQHIGEVPALRCDLLAGTAGRVVLVGDSHMTQWLPAVLPWARARGLSVTTYLKSGCALTGSPLWPADCQEWNDRVWPLLRGDPPDYVLTSSISALRPAERAGRIAGLVPRWRQVTRLGTTLIAFRDIPQPHSAGRPDVPACLVARGSVAACRFDERAGLSQDLVRPAARRVPGAHLIDLAAYFCPDGVCQPARDGLLTYISGGHMSSWFARGLAGALAERLDRVAGLG